MQVVLVGLSHKTAPVEVREKVALAPAAYPETLRALTQRGPLRECVVLSTCNRTEVYGAADAYHDGQQAVERVLCDLGARAAVRLDDHLYRYHGVEAARHLFRVAASLDSLVVGEPQILGQVKEAFLAAGSESTAGLVLGRLFRQALQVGKRVRTATGIGALAVSVPSVAVELAEKIFGALEGRAALVVGAGETAELTVLNLRDCGVRRVTVANRTRATAEALATPLGARAVGLEALPAALAEADIVVCSAASPEPLVPRVAVEAAMRERRGRPMFLIDIAVPRNVEPAVAEVYGVYLYDIDDLEQVVAANRDRRAAEAERAEALVDDEVRRFAAWWESLDAVPTLVALRDKMDRLRAEETRRLLAKLGDLPPRDRALVERFGTQLIRKILHDPTTRLRGAGGAERAGSLAAGLRYLFRLDETEPDEGEAAGPAADAADEPPAAEPDEEPSRD